MDLRAMATCPAVTCDRNTPVQEVAYLMSIADVGLVIVVDGERPVGVVTDRDIVLRVVVEGHDVSTPVREVMTHHTHHVDEHATIEHAAEVMADKQCRRLAVTDDAGRVVGVLSADDLLRVAGAELQHVARATGAPHGHGGTP